MFSQTMSHEPLGGHDLLYEGLLSSQEPTEYKSRPLLQDHPVW
jgi:hypothetical protein